MPKPIEKQQKEESKLNKNIITEVQKEFRKQLALFITGAFSFVAALLWKDAITESLKPITDKGGSALLLRYVIALLITVIAVTIIIFISKIFRLEQKN